MGTPKDPEAYALWKSRISDSWKNMDPEKRASRVQKIKDARAKQVSPMKGKRLAKSTKDKIAQGVSDHYNSLSEDEKKKRWEKWQDDAQKAMQEKLKNMSQTERIEFYKPWIEAGHNAVSVAYTSIEIVFSELLKERNIKFTQQKWIGKYKVDFFLPDQNTIIEIYGCFWHQCSQCNFDDGYRGKTAEQIRTDDLARMQFLVDQGYEVKIIWEHQLKGK